MGAAWWQARLSLFGIIKRGLGLVVGRATATDLQKGALDIFASMRYIKVSFFSMAYRVRCWENSDFLPRSR